MDHQLQLPNPILEGFLLGISLIAAIGAQNMFIIRQGIIGRYHLAAAAFCTICDIFLICIGTLGAGSLIAGNDLLEEIAVVGGILFLSYYGFTSFRNAFKGHSLEGLIPSADTQINLKSVMVSALGFSLLNPHAFLDAVVLLGGLSGQYETLSERISFTFGACISSLVWFFSLAICARALGPYFRKPKFAVGLDLLTGTIMFWIAFTLAHAEWFE